ncbi:MAG: DNA alkylation repair protein [Kofleriaceae bacterium]
MPSKLKDFFDRSVISAIAGALRRGHRQLDERAFVAECMAGLDALELVGRGAHIAAAMRRHLLADYRAAIDAMLGALDFELATPSSMAAFRYLPHTIYVSSYGLDDFETSMRAQHALTQRFSAEFSIRPFLERYPEQTLARLAAWTRDPSYHVRRLVSEGTRPRLPWGQRLRAFIDDPRPVLALLEPLVDDPELYVRRSVANNLNDIAKDHPEIVVATCQRWLADATEARTWIVRHALRSLVKQGHRGALSLLGAGATPLVELDGIDLPARLAIGGALELSFELASTTTRAQDLVVDFAIHYVKASGARSPKVFKLKRLSLAPRARVRLAAKVSFADMSTRKHHPGLHAVEARINGVAFPLGEISVGARS